MKRLLVVVLLLCGVSAPGWAQVAVLEAPGPLLTETTWGAVQQTLNTIEAVFHSTQWVLTLTSFEETGLDGFEGDLADLEGIIGETQALLWDMQSILNETTRLFGLEEAPDSTAGLRERLWEIRRLQRARQVQAQRVQTLPARVTNVVNRIRGLWGRILEVLGEKQGSQQIQAMLQQVQYLEGQTQVVAAAFQNAMLTDAMEHQLVDESLFRINEAIYATMPRP